MLDSERLSGEKKLMDDLAMLGFEPASLGQSEPLVREKKISDVFQCRPHAAELLLETGAERGDSSRGTIRRPHRIERIR